MLFIMHSTGWVTVKTFGPVIKYFVSSVFAVLTGVNEVSK